MQLLSSFILSKIYVYIFKSSLQNFVKHFSLPELKNVDLWRHLKLLFTTKNVLMYIGIMPYEELQINSIEELRLAVKQSLLLLFYHHALYFLLTKRCYAKCTVAHICHFINTYYTLFFKMPAT